MIIPSKWRICLLGKAFVAFIDVRFYITDYFFNLLGRSKGPGFYSIFQIDLVQFTTKKVQYISLSATFQLHSAGYPYPWLSEILPKHCQCREGYIPSIWFIFDQPFFASIHLDQLYKIWTSNVPYMILCEVRSLHQLSFLHKALVWSMCGCNVVMFRSRALNESISNIRSKDL